MSASSELGIRFTGDTTSADAAANRTTANLKRVGEAAQQANRDIAASNAATQKTSDQVSASLQKTSAAAAQAGRDLVDAGRAAANGDWASAAQNVGRVGEAAGVSRMTLVGFAATVGVAAVALTTLYRAYEGGVAEVDNMNRAIALSGNYAGQTRSSMRELALEMTTFASNVKESKDTVIALAGSGLIASQSFESVSRLVGEYASATKRSVDEVRPEIIKLFSDPARGAEELNRSMHFLTAAELEHIRTLQESGREGEAQLLLSDRLRDAVSKHETQLGLLDRALRTVKNAWQGFWDSALAVGRPASLSEKIESQRAAVEGLSNSKSPTAGRKLVAASGLLSQLEAQQQAEADAAWVSSFKAQQEKNRIAWGDLAKNYRTNAERAAEEMKKAKQLALNSGMSLDDPSVQKVLTQIQDKYKDKAPKTSDYDRLSERVKEYATQLDLAAEKGDKLSQGDRLQIDIQRELSATQQASLQPLLEHIKAREQAAEAAKKQAAAEASLLQIQSLDQTFQRDLQSRRLQMQDMPALDRQRMIDQLALEDKARSTRDQLARQLQRKEITPSQYADGVDKLNQVLDRQRTAIADIYTEQENLNGSWERGAKSALTLYQDYAKNTFAQTRDVVLNAFRSMEDALTTFVMTGKLDFRSLADSIIADIVRMESRKLISSFFGGSSGATGGASAAGTATAGAASGNLFSSLFSWGASFFSGGGIMTADGPVPLRKYSGGGIADRPQAAIFGEGDTPEAYVPVPSGRIPVELRDSRGKQGAGAPPSISVSVYVDAKGTRVEGDTVAAKAVGDQFKDGVLNVLRSQMRNGGMLEPLSRMT